MEEITSRRNPLCVHFRKLASSRAYRQEQGEFFCDSPKLLQEALRWGAPVHTVLYTRQARLPALEGRSLRLIPVSEAVMAAVSPMEAPQGVVFSCGIPRQEPPDPLPEGRYLVLDGVQDPGNVGTILRTADAFDCGGMFLLPGCADLYNPKTLRAAMGVHFRRPLFPCTLETLAGRLSAAGIPLYAAALGADSADLRAVDLSNSAVAIGSEGRGVSPQVLARCRRTLKIPMSPRCESLNAAAAAAVVLWEGYRSAPPRPAAKEEGKWPL